MVNISLDNLTVLQLQNVTTPTDFLTTVNSMSGGLLGPSFLVVIFFVAMFSAPTGNWRRNFSVALIITFVASVALFSIGLVPVEYVIVLIALSILNYVIPGR